MMIDAALDRRATEDGVSEAELPQRFARERAEPLRTLEADPMGELVGLVDDSDDDGRPWDVDAVVYGDRSGDQPGGRFDGADDANR